jgi:hypothetical protein
MKLLHCADCGDMRALHQHLVYCECGKVWGEYKADGAHATVSAHAKVIALANQDVRSAAYYASGGNPPKDVGYMTIRAWMILPGARVAWEKEKDDAATETAK